MIQIEHFLVYRAARFCYQFVTDPQHRSVALIRLRKPENLFQPQIDTASDRYPALFAFARDQLGDGVHIRLLSFGCSTGEEAFTLRRYFAKATIKSIDINPRNIAICNARQTRSPDAGIVFAVGNSTANEPAESYDAIFCLAVLRHGRLGRPGAGRCDPLIRFADFGRTVADFARCLKAGGSLFITHSNFRFCDTAVARDFEVIWRQPPVAEAKTPLFDRHDRRMDGAAYGDLAFRKRAR